MKAQKRSGDQTGALKELREIQDEAETARVNEPLTVRFVGKAEELSM